MTALLLMIVSGISLLSDDPLKIGIYQNNPKVFVDEDGRPKGFFVEITEEIARQNAFSVQFVPGTWSENILKLTRGELDILVDVSYLDERAKLFSFNKIPAIESWIQAFSLEERKIQAIEEFQGKTVAVIQESTQEKYLTEEIRDECGIECKVLSLSGYSDMVHAVQTGKADLFLGDRFFLYSSEKPDEVIANPIVIRPQGLYFAFRRNLDESIRMAFDAALFNMKTNGDTVYYKAFNKWFNYRRDQPSHLLKLMLVLFPLALLILVSVVFWNRLLQKEVKKQTARWVESELKFGFMVKNSNDILVIVSKDGIQKFISPVAKSVTGYSIEELKVPFWELLHPDDLGYVMDAWRQCIEHPEKAVFVQYRHKHKTREWVSFEAVAQNYLSHPAIQGVLVNVRDISERREAEVEREKLQAQLAHAQKMESVGRLAGGIAHDFNNMLSVIVSNAEMGMMGTTRENPLYKRMEEIKRAADRSSELTRQLLSFARKQVTAPRTIDMDDSIGNMLGMLQRLIGENINLSWKPGETLWPVRIDPTQLDQILVNLCVNARDAISGCGSILIAAENQVVDELFCKKHPFFLPGEYIRLTVTDNGAGMDEETCRYIFEPFFTTKQPDKGTGLGLSIVYDIVKQNNGYITVESKPQQGTSFAIYLPRNGRKGAGSEGA